MDALLSALATKFAGSDLSNYVGGRIYFDRAPDRAVYPYVVYSIVSAAPQDTFTESLDDVLIQVSLFSSSGGGQEIATMYGYLKTLLDDAVLTVTGYTNIWTRREGMTTMVEDITTAEGTAPVKHWAVDYSVMMQKS